MRRQLGAGRSSSSRRREGPLAWIAALSVALSAPALAVDGVVEINRARVDQGGITAGDTPGFPATISRSGSYRLTGDLLATSRAVVLVEITAPRVTLDLNGFTVGSCVEGGLCGIGSANGISGPNQSDVRIRDGHVLGSGGICIRLGMDAVVEDVHVRGCGRDGILVSSGSRVEGVTAIGSAEVGIECGSHCTIRDSKAIDNESIGINTGRRSVVQGNVASSNDVGIIASGSIVRDNDASANDSHGIQSTFLGGLVVDNRMRSNGGCGLYAAGNRGTAYGNNILFQNNGPGDANLQVYGGTEIATNFCGTNTSCGTGTATTSCP